MKVYHHTYQLLTPLPRAEQNGVQLRLFNNTPSGPHMETSLLETVVLG